MLPRRATSSDGSSRVRITLFTKIFLGYVLLLAVALAMPAVLSQTATPLDWRPWITLGTGIALSLGLAWVLTRILGRIRVLNAFAERISRGDLSQPLEVRSGVLGHDEIDDLTTSVIHMQENLRDLVGHIQRSSSALSEASSNLQSSAERVNVASQGVSGAIEQIASGAELQRELVDRTSKLITEIAASISRTAASAEDAARKAKRKIATAEETVEAQAAEHPWRTLGIVGLAGFALGLLIRR
jgi:methyl-accepting chemotaxis protein